MQNNGLLLLVLVSALFLNACTSTEPEAQTGLVDALEVTALSAVKVGSSGEIDAALTAALTRYQSLDDIPGQWRVVYLTIRVKLSRGELPSQEIEHLKALNDLHPGRFSSYQTFLVTGSANQNLSDFEAALDLASTSLEKAVALTYLGRFNQAINTIEPALTTNAGDRAFVYYHYAVHEESMEHFQQALRFYRRAADSRGIADSLVNLAKLSANEKQLTNARNYANRAIKVLNSSGDQRRAQSINDWLSSIE